MARFIDSYENIPLRSGNVCLKVYSNENETPFVAIVGDAEGLRYLARVLNYMADVDVESQDMPAGERAHIPLSPGRQLVMGSNHGEVCRAEAKGGGQVPDYFQVQKN